VIPLFFKLISILALLSNYDRENCLINLGTEGWLAKGYGSFQSAWRTLQGIETVHMIRKGRVRWLAKDDGLGQALFITDLFGIPG
jgi:hypothetical protein